MTVLRGKNSEKCPIFLDPSDSQVIFFPKWSIKISCDFLVVLSASRRFFLAMKNNYPTKKAKKPKKNIYPKWKNLTRYGWFGHLLPICLYLPYIKPIGYHCLNEAGRELNPTFKNIHIYFFIPGQKEIYTFKIMVT